MKVLVADKFEKAGLEGLKSIGCDVTYEPEAAGTLGEVLARAKPDSITFGTPGLQMPPLPA